MDSEVIKTIVAQVNAVCANEDESTPEQLNGILGLMNKECNKSPTFAVAIIQHLTESGIDVMKMDLPNSDEFRAKFQAQVEKLGERELMQIRKISSKLFA